MAACSLAIEAAWAAGGELAGLTASALTIAMVIWVPTNAVRPSWNPCFGAIFFLAALASGVGGAVPDRAWWPVCVVTASIASQAHLMYALASVTLVVLTLVVGGIDTVRSKTVRSRACGAKTGYRWVIIGLLLGVACWSGPFIQQFTSRTGNLSALIANSESGIGPRTGPVLGSVPSPPRSSRSRSGCGRGPRRARPPASRRGAQPVARGGGADHPAGSSGRGAGPAAQPAAGRAGRGDPGAEPGALVTLIEHPNPAHHPDHPGLPDHADAAPRCGLLAGHRDADRADRPLGPGAELGHRAGLAPASSDQAAPASPEQPRSSGWLPARWASAVGIAAPWSSPCWPC